MPGDHVQGEWSSSVAQSSPRNFCTRVTGCRYPRNAPPGRGSHAGWPGRCCRWGRGRGCAARRHGSRRCAPGTLVQELDAKLHATRDHRDLQGLHVQQAQLGGQAQAALFGDDQPFTIGVEEHALHRSVGAVDVHADAGRLFGVGGGGDGQQAVDEIGALGGDVVGIPAQAVGVDRPSWRPGICRSRRWKRGCAADGRMRYSQVRRASARGTVKAVPENCSA